jgi:dTDP-4-dehydrorhamnose 3,5-epimerase
MHFEPTALDGTLLITPHRYEDQRGFFARLYCAEEFAAAGIPFHPPQMNLSRSSSARTLRGMHYQDHPFAEAKLVRVASGKIYDVVVDLRRQSRTYLSWIAVTLDSEAGQSLYVPEGCAHGFLTLEPNTDVLYLMSRAHVPGQAKGLRYDDPAIRIEWPASPLVVSPADLAWPAWAAEPH